VGERFVNNFYIDDEPAEDIRQAWRRGRPVLIVPADWWRRLVKWHYAGGS